MTNEEAITCKNCKHRPIDDHGSIEPPYDVENRRLDETCPCINKADWHYSYVPEDEFFCAYAEKKPVTPTRIETVTEFADRCMECGNKYGKRLKQLERIKERYAEERVILLNNNSEYTTNNVLDIIDYIIHGD